MWQALLTETGCVGDWSRNSDSSEKVPCLLFLGDVGRYLRQGAKEHVSSGTYHVLLLESSAWRGITSCRGISAEAGRDCHSSRGTDQSADHHAGPSGLSPNVRQPLTAFSEGQCTLPASTLNVPGPTPTAAASTRHPISLLPRPDMYPSTREGLAVKDFEVVCLAHRQSGRYWI